MNRKLYLEEIIKVINTLNSDLFLTEIKKNTHHYELAERAMKNKTKKWYNKRIDEYTKKDLNKWEHLTKKYLEESKNIKSSESTNPIFDKIWRSRFGNIDPINSRGLSGYPKNMDKIYVSDYIMFNPNCKLTFDQVDRILPYIKFKKIDSNTVQIDRWIFKEKGFFLVGSDRPNYDITYSNEELKPDEFVKTEEDKWLVVRAMLQIMNDTPDEFVNFNSYQIIGHWYNKNDSWLVSWPLNNYNKNDYDSNSNKLTKSELIINLDGKLEKDELINMLYDYAINGGIDLQNTGIIFDKKNFTSITSIIMKELSGKIFNKDGNKDGNKINSIADAKINTVIDLNILDLTEYLKANGEEKTRQLIEDINQRIKYKFNCANITKPDGKKITKFDLLARMYNLSLPFGMGIVSQVEKINTDKKNLTMSSSDAEKLFFSEINSYGNKSEYFDYIHGISIKTDFSSFPIIYYRGFEKYNGSGSFIRCIESLKTHSDVDKTLPTIDYIKSEIKRMSD